MKTFHALRALCLFSGVAFAFAAAPVSAQQSASMPGMDMSASADAGSGAATQAYKDADEKMMQDMDSAYTAMRTRISWPT